MIQTSDAVQESSNITSSALELKEDSVQGTTGPHIDGCVSLYIGNLPREKNCTAEIVSILAPFIHRFYRITYRSGHAFLDCNVKRGCTVEQVTTAGSGVTIRNSDNTVSVIRVSVANPSSRGPWTQIDDKRTVYLYPIQPRTPRDEIHKFLFTKSGVDAACIDRFDELSCARVSVHNVDDAFRLVAALNGSLFSRDKLVVTHMGPAWMPGNFAPKNTEDRKHARESKSGENDSHNGTHQPKSQKISDISASANLASFHIFGFRTSFYPYAAEILQIFSPFVKEFLKLRHRRYGYAFLDVELKDSVTPDSVIQQLKGKSFGPNRAQPMQVNTAAKPGGSLLEEISHRYPEVYVYPLLEDKQKMSALLKEKGCGVLAPTVKELPEFNCVRLKFDSLDAAEKAQELFRSHRLSENIELIATRMEPGGHPMLLQRGEDSAAPKNHRPETREEPAARMPSKSSNTVISIRFEDLNKRSYNYAADIVRALQPYTADFLKMRRSDSAATVEVILNTGITEDSVKSALRAVPLNEFQGRTRVSIESGRTSAKHKDNETVLYLYPLHDSVTAQDLDTFLSANKCHPQHAAIDVYHHCAVLVMRSDEEASDAIEDVHGKFWSTIRSPVVCTHMHP